MSAPKNRPLFQVPGHELIELLNAGVASARAEAKFRHTPKVRAAARAYDERTPQATPTPTATAPTSANRTISGGIGSRGGNVRWGIASAVARAEDLHGDELRARSAQVHAELVPMTPAQVKAYAEEHNVRLAANAKIGPAVKAA